MRGARGFRGRLVAHNGSAITPVPDVPPPQTAPLQISSVPSGASVLVDGQPLGTTPASLALDPGQHAIVVRAHDAIDESRTVDLDADGASLALSLWRAHPISSR